MLPRFAKTLGSSSRRWVGARGLLKAAAVQQPWLQSSSALHAASGSRRMMATDAKEMFCFQCEQTEHGTGCTTIGVCGKTPQVAAMQDCLVETLKGLSYWAEKARELNQPTTDADNFILPALFSTLTNVNFDPERFVTLVDTAQKLRNEVRDNVLRVHPPAADEKHPVVADWKVNTKTVDDIELAGREVGIESRKKFLPEDAVGLQELIVYGLKGAAAYANHALELGKTDPAVTGFMYKALSALGRNEADPNALVALAMGTGECNLKVLQLLSEGHHTRYGAPTPTKVNIEPVEGKCILVSGHDMRDLERLLEQSAGKGVNVYTHGEMLPAHGYPGLKDKYPHLVGHYGGPWQLQKFDFSRFPGAIMMTTNCLTEPRKKYKENMFTVNVTGWPGVKQIGDDKDFTPVIEKALSLEGFKKSSEPKYVTTGFGHETVLSVAGDVLDAAKSGNLRRILFIGGCDGTEGERNYYTELAKNLPQESLILTAGCGKFRLLGKKDYGNLPGTEIPRLLDMGQCNDSYSAVVVAQELAKALNTDINSLPLTIVVSWFEQKAVAVLLTLLHLGIKDMHIGPKLPAFLTPSTVQFLVDKFNLHPIDHTAGVKDAERFVAGLHV